MNGQKCSGKHRRSAILPAIRALPPAAAALSPSDIWQAFVYYKKTKDSIADFESALQDYFSVRHAFAVSSGRAALTITLLALKKDRAQNQVIIPDYTCFSVPSAIAKAGLRISPVDIGSGNLDYDLNKLNLAVSTDTLAVIAVHPYGLPCRIQQIRQICQLHRIPLIEDAAQAMGASVGNRKVGTFGDVSVLSFGRGKAMTTVSGGAILTDSDALARIIRETIDRYNVDGQNGRRFWPLALAYSVSIRPSVFPMIKCLPFLEVGVTRFSTSYSISRMTSAQAALGSVGLAHLDEQNRLRREHAACLRELLVGIRGLQLLGERDDDYGVYLRQPLLFESAEQMEKAFLELTKCGLGAGTPYPTCISDINEASGYIVRKTDSTSDSQEVVRRMLTLPTHHLVTITDLDRMANIIRKSVSCQ